MENSLHRALVFSVTVFLLLLVSDIAAWGVYQGENLEAQGRPLLLIHASLLVSVFVSSFCGAIVVFGLSRQRLPTAKATAYLALAFAAVSFFAVVAAFTAAGIIGTLLWLLLGSALFAWLSTLTAKNTGS